MSRSRCLWRGLWRAWHGDLNHIATSQETQKENPVSAAIVSFMDPLLRWAKTKEDAMIDNEPRTAGRRKQRLAGAVGLLLAGGLAGGVLAATNSASAADTTTTAAVQSAGVPAAGGPAAPADTATPVRAGEKALTDSDLATAKAAALKAVPGGTVFRVETDADGATYEAHMTKANGTHVTVKLDKSFKVTEVQDGMGAGGPGGAGGPAAPGQGAAPAPGGAAL